MARNAAGSTIADKAMHGLWRNMKRRCLDERHISFKHYGAKGVKVCARWADSFAAFLEDMGPRPEGMTIDRIDPNGDYEPANCRWATHTKQARNKRNVKKIPVEGENLSLPDACERFGVNVITAHSRINSGWKHIDAVSRPAVPPTERVKFKRNFHRKQPQE